jgi:hypothetical protein
MQSLSNLSDTTGADQERAAMADEENEDRFWRHEEIMSGLYAMLQAQHKRNQRLDTVIEELREANRVQRIFNVDVSKTLAQVETLLKRMIRGEENGRDA